MKKLKAIILIISLFAAVLTLGSCFEDVPDSPGTPVITPGGDNNKPDIPGNETTPPSDDKNDPADDENKDDSEPDDPSEGEKPDIKPDAVYYTVKFDTGVSGVSLSDKLILGGTKLPLPALFYYRDGMRIAGWMTDGGELYDFNTPVSGNMKLTAVWEKETDGHIYDSATRVFMIHDGTVGASEFANTLVENLSPYISVGVGLYDHSEAEKYHEFAIGKTNREISKAAYLELDKMADGKECIAYLVYSDGKSLALAYTGFENEMALDLLSELFINNYVKESLTLEAGIYDSYCLPIYEHLKAADEKNSAEQWEALENVLKRSIGVDGAAEFVAALRDLYSLYKPEMTEWYARLYDPEIGGYYYSNSAKNNGTVTYQGVTYPLLPDIESTNQSLNFLVSSGMLKNYGKELPAFMREQILGFIKGCQDPNGYFYNPQWPKSLTDSKTSRRSRDLGWSESILSYFEEKPYYTTPNGMQGSGIRSASHITPPLSHSVAVAVSKAVPTATVTNKNLQDKASFEAYLASLDIKNLSYHVGNELTSQNYEILERDRQLKAEGAGYSLMDILISWLNKNQNPETGHWHHTSNYYGVNGLLKISGIYNAAKVPLPNAKAAAQSAIDAITSDEKMGAVVDLYNTWFSIQNILNNLRKYGTEADENLADVIVTDLRAKASAAILKSKEKIAVFQKPDGSFSYTPSYSSNTSQGMPVALPNSYEGDVNATGISSTGLVSYIMGALELSSYKPALFGKAEFYNYMRIIEGKDLGNSSENYGKIDFEDGNIPSNVSSNLVTGGASVEIGEKDGDKSLVFKTTPGGNDSLTVQTVTVANTDTSVFDADISISDIKGSTLYQVMFDSSSGTRAYMLVFGYSNGYLTVSDCSSTGDGSTRREQLITGSLEIGKEFRLRVEYSKTGENVNIKVLIDNKIVFYSDNFYNSHKSEAEAQIDITKVRFYALNAAEATLIIDNVVLTQTASK